MEDTCVRAPAEDTLKETRLDGPGGDPPSGLNGAMIPWLATTKVPFENPRAIGAIPPEENGDPATGVSTPVCASTWKTAIEFEP